MMPSMMVLKKVTIPWKTSTMNPPAPAGFVMMIAKSAMITPHLRIAPSTYFTPSTKVGRMSRADWATPFSQWARRPISFTLG